MLAFNVLLFALVCLTAIVTNVDAFHSRYFDDYEDDWRFKRPLKRPVVVSESVEVPVDEVKPVDVPPPEYESGERYFSRPHYGRPSYYEPKPFYSSYGYRPRYGKK